MFNSLLQLIICWKSVFSSVLLHAIDRRSNCRKGLSNNKGGCVYVWGGEGGRGGWLAASMPHPRVWSSGGKECLCWGVVIKRKHVLTQFIPTLSFNILTSQNEYLAVIWSCYGSWRWKLFYFLLVFAADFAVDSEWRRIVIFSCHALLRGLRVSAALRFILYRQTSVKVTSAHHNPPWLTFYDAIALNLSFRRQRFR